jgi:hypothetical protein
MVVVVYMTAYTGGFMSRELRSAIRGSIVGTGIGLGFGIATLDTIGFHLMTFFEGLLLLSCSMFGGFLFGSLIGVTGAFRKEPVQPVITEEVTKAVA